MSPADTDILTAVLYTVFSVLVMLSNTIVIVVIATSRELHQPTLWNLALMAALDFALAGCVIMFVVPSKIMNDFAYPDSYQGFSAMVLTFIVTQNNFNILLALVDRYISTCWPLRYSALMSSKRFTFAVVVLFLLSIVRVTILASTDGAWRYDKTLGLCVQENPTVIRSYSRILLFVQFIIIVGLLIRIRVELYKMNRNENTGDAQSVSRQFTNTMYISVVVYMVCYIPITILALVVGFMEVELVLWVQIGNVCLVSNSLWNVFIYAVTYRPFRDAFLKLFRPTYFREQARRELQVTFRRDRISVIPMEGNIRLICRYL